MEAVGIGEWVNGYEGHWGGMNDEGGDMLIGDTLGVWWKIAKRESVYVVVDYVKESL